MEERGEEKTCPQGCGMSCDVWRRVRICVCVSMLESENEGEA